MKKALQIGMLLFAFQLAAQVPNQFNYQAVLRDNLGAPLATQNVSVRIGIYSGAGAALKLFEEEHTLTTSDRGLIDLRVGGGNVGFGNFAAIDWTNNEYHMKVEVNTGGGFINIGTQQLVSVPFALAAKKATDMEMSDITNVSSTVPNAGQVLKWNGSIWEPSDDLQGTGGGGATYTPGAGINISGGNVISISNSGVSTAMLANGAVTNAKLASNAVQSGNIQNGAISADKLAQMGATIGEVLKWNGTAWAPATDLTGGGGGGGAPTGPAGGDLTGTYPDPLVANNAINTAKIANSAVNNQKIANGAVSGDKLNQMSATTGQVLTWTGATWEPTTIGTGGAPSGPAGGDLTGTYPNPTIASNAISTIKIANSAVTTAKIAASAVTANELANNAVTTTKIQNGAVTLDKLAQAGATNGQAIIWNGTAWVPTTIGGGGAPTGPAGGDLTGTYPNPTVANSAISNAKIANSAVTSAKIANSAVTMAKIDQAGATSGQVITWNGTSWAPAAAGGSSTPTGPAGGDLTGTYPDPTIAINAITTAKVSNSAITDAKLANNAVTNAKIAGAAVTGDKISPMSATSGQVLTWNGTTWLPTTVSGGGSPSGPAGGDLSGTYPNPLVASNAITTIKIANNAVIASKIADGNVITSKLATGAVTAVKIDQMGAANNDLLTYSGGSWGPVSRSIISPWNVKANGDIDFPNGRVFIGASWGGLPQNFNLAVIDTTPTYIVVGGTQVNTGVNGGLALTEGFNSIGSCGFDFVVDGSAFGNTGLFLVAGCPDKNDTVFEVTRGGFTTWRDVLRVDINQGPDNKFANNNVDADLQVNMRIFVNTTTTSVNRRKGIAIRHRANSTRQWNIATRDNSNLEFFHDGTLRGTFSSTNGVYTSSSDRKLKTDIIEMPSVLTQVKALDAYTYRFIWQTEEEQQRSLGFMAQDVRKFFPELVYEATFDDGEESWLQMDYAGMSVIAIKAIQEQQEIIEAQQQRIEALENTIMMFSQRLENVEKQNATITAEK